MKFSNAHMTRLALDWGKLAGEPIRVEQIGSVLYAYGSELACLRLFHKFRDSSQEHICAYSVNLGTWYFSLVTPS